MERESEILMMILEDLQDLSSTEFLLEAERITGMSFSRSPGDILWDVTGNVEPKTKIGLLN